ncbi:flagellar hook basal-body protein [bacterium]|nr:flagellar hook basal-body protein [bacterium]
MANFQGIIRKSASSALTQFEKLGYHSQNFANMNTTAYKGVSFEEVMTTEGYMQGCLRTNTAQGGIQRTQNPLDIAIDGAGYIPITSAEGNIYYTRDGHFTTDKEGYIKTLTGDMVGAGIQIDPNSARIEIKKNGDVYTYKTKTATPEYKGTIPLVTFNNPESLKEVGGNKYITTEDSGEPMLEKDTKKIAQYSTERSNVDMFREVTEVLRVNAQMTAQTKLIQAIDSLYEKSIQIGS